MQGSGDPPDDDRRRDGSSPAEPARPDGPDGPDENTEPDRTAGADGTDGTDGTGGTGAAGGATGTGSAASPSPRTPRSWHDRPHRTGGAAAPPPRRTLAGTSRRRSRRARVLAAGGTALLLTLAGTGVAVWNRLSGNITADEAAARELGRYEKERPNALVHGAQNILLIGSDSRSGANGSYGKDNGTARSDSTILLHLAADRNSATAVSIPRDLMVDVPGCRDREGEYSGPAFTMFNSAFEKGGSACTIRTVEKLTGIRVGHHVIVDFAGFKKVVDAVGGVEVCVPRAVDDPRARLRLSAGRQELDGEEALGWVRARKSLGNGSDTDRMDRQQRFLASLVRKMQSEEVLLNPAKLYPVLDAATSSLTTDPGLAELGDLYQLVRGMRDIPSKKVHFLTVPRHSDPNDANRDQLLEDQAETLFHQLRYDLDVDVSPRTPREEAARSGRHDHERREKWHARKPDPYEAHEGITAGEGGDCD